jgi:UDP-N-acetylmuramate dehydrogenase
MFKKNVNVAKFTTLNIGPKAQYFCRVSTFEQMQSAIQFAKEYNLPFFVLGKGSNLLFEKNTYQGLVIHNKINHFELKETLLTVGSGYSFAYLGKKISKLGLSGLEFASGIPGTVGGAVYMNAGANAQDTGSILSQCKVLDENGNIVTKERKDLFFAYRSSSFQTAKEIILEATFQLKQDEQASKRQQELLQKRLQTQPYNEKSAGCCFKNPEHISAGQLIEECGLKGMQIGGAMVSKKHANFIINASNANAKDVKKLIEFVKKKVKQERGVELELEINQV